MFDLSSMLIRGGPNSSDIIVDY
ncbi:ACD_00320 [African swine fever virus]